MLKGLPASMAWTWLKHDQDLGIAPQKKWDLVFHRHRSRFVGYLLMVTPGGVAILAGSGETAPTAPGRCWKNWTIPTSASSTLLAAVGQLWWPRETYVMLAVHQWNGLRNNLQETVIVSPQIWKAFLQMFTNSGTWRIEAGQRIASSRTSLEVLIVWV